VIINTISTIMASFRPECKHFANGTCKFGSNCRDSHTVKATGVVLASSTTTTITERVIMPPPGVSIKSPKLAVVKPAIAAATEPPTVECVLCFDTTGSMFPYLESVRKELVATVNKLVAKATKHGHALRLGVIAHGDYCDKASSYVDKFLPLHDALHPPSVAALIAFVAGVGPTSGGDAPECYELALHRCWKDMGWGPKSTRTVIMVGDATPHPVGYTCNGYTNGLDWRNELASLKAKNIKVYAVQAGCTAAEAAASDAAAAAGEEWACNACSMGNAPALAMCSTCASPKLENPEPTANAFWSAVASRAGAGGQRFAVGDLATVRGLILAAVCKDMGHKALEELGVDLRAEGSMTAELKHVYAVMTRTVTTTTTVLAAGGGGGLGLAALVSGGPGARGGGALYGGGSLGSGGGGALLGGGGGKAAPKVYDLDRDDVAVCAHFLKGTCKYGAKCDKPHAKPAAKPAPASGAKKSVVPCKRGAVCPFLKAGTCTFKH